MDTLVLSVAFEPLDRVSWQRAVTLWWSDKVEIVEAYTDRSVRGVDFSMGMPSVVRFRRPVRKHRALPRFSRENVYARDRGRCMYCGSAVAKSESTYDHVVPRSLGGRTTWTNVVIACLACNQKKGCRTPEQARMALLVRPVRPRSLPSNGPSAWPGMPTAWRDYLGSLS